VIFRAHRLSVDSHRQDDRRGDRQEDPMTRLGNRCSVSALVVLTVTRTALAQTPVLDDFVLFGSGAVRARGLEVVSGDVGTNGTLIGTRRIDAADRIVGNHVELDRASSCKELLARPGDGVPKCGPAKPVAIPVVADLAGACGFPSPFPTECSGTDITVGHDGFEERGPGSYGVVDVAGGGRGPGTLVLTGGTYTFCRLRLGRKATLLASGPVTINVIGALKLDNGSELHPASGAIGPCVRIFANTTGKVRISRKAHVQAILCAPYGKLDVTAGANLRGAFFAGEVKSDRVVLEHVAMCVATSTSTSTSTTIGSSTSSSSSSSSSSSTSTVAQSSTTSTSTPSTSTSIVPTTTVAGSTSTTASTSSSTSSSSSSVTTTSNTTSTSVPPSGFDFLSTVGSGICGHTYRDLDGTRPLKNLLCGRLSLGGGLSQVPDNETPAGATNRFGLSCVGSVCTVGPASPATAEYACTDTGCFFGTPLPISNVGISVCVTNTFSAPVSGTLDTSSGTATLNFQLQSATVLTGNPAQPCPICAVSVGGAPCDGTASAPCTGVCDGSPNQGAACTSKNANGLTRDCPSPAAIAGVQRCYRGANNGAVCSTGGQCPGGLCAGFIGNIPISLNPLTTSDTSRSDGGGLFCPDQGPNQKGAFRTDICQSGPKSGSPCTAATAVADCGAGVTCRAGTLNNYCNGGANDGLGCSNATNCPAPGACVRAGTLVQLIREVGTPAGALAIGVPKPISLGTVFCVPKTSNPIVDSNANLPGPGATSIVGTVTLIP